MSMLEIILVSRPSERDNLHASAIPMLTSAVYMITIPEACQAQDRGTNSLMRCIRVCIVACVIVKAMLLSTPLMFRVADGSKQTLQAVQLIYTQQDLATHTAAKHYHTTLVPT